MALLARGDAGLEVAAKEIKAAGGRALVVPVDTADAHQLDLAAQRVEAELGPIDVWVNDAFTSVFAPFTEISADEFSRVTEVSYLGYVYGTRAALRHMMPRDRGAIIQVGSALAYRGIPLQSAYCGAKHAIQGFTESVRCELLHEHSDVRITMVQMPAVNTPQFSWVLSRLPGHPQPVPPIYQPEVAARAVLWAADHDRREWWVGASTAATLHRQHDRFREHWTGTLLGRATRASRWTRQSMPTGPSTCGQPADEPQRLRRPWHLR